MSDSNALAWMDQISQILIKCNGRALSQKQRAAVLGTLLTLDPESPFYSVKSEVITDLRQQLAAALAERDRAVKDAERYLCIRDAIIGNDAMSAFFKSQPNPTTAEEMDALIDRAAAAIAAGGEEKINNG